MTTGYGYRFDGYDIPAIPWAATSDNVTLTLAGTGAGATPVAEGAASAGAGVGVVDDFQKALVVYLRCATRLEAAKKMCPLDGDSLTH